MIGSCGLYYKENFSKSDLQREDLEPPELMFDGLGTIGKIAFNRAVSQIGIQVDGILANVTSEDGSCFTGAQGRHCGSFHVGSSFWWWLSPTPSNLPKVT